MLYPLEKHPKMHSLNISRTDGTKYTSNLSLWILILKSQLLLIANHSLKITNRHECAQLKVPANDRPAQGKGPVIIIDLP